MNRRLLGALAITVLGSVSQPALADSIAVGDALRFNGSDGTIGGGAFHVDNLSNGVGEDFLTFCLQQSQYIDYSRQFYVGGIGQAADDTPEDPISEQTAWLFAKFRRGALSGYANGNTLSANSLQRAIWWLEGEGNNGYTTDGVAQNWVAQANLAVLNGWRNNGHVRVLNLFYDRDFTRKAQDQLAVPEPASLGLMGLALAAAAARRRRKQPLSA